MNVPTEQQECIAFSDWLDRQVVEGKVEKFTHFPAGEKRDKITASLLKKMGLRKGFPDFIVAVNKRLIFIEMKKRDRTNRMSKEQKDWKEVLESMGHEFKETFGAKEAKEFVEENMEKKDDAT